jgi:molecular chaperone GrpE
MRDRDRRRIDAAEPEPPAPEAQGDGEPAPDESAPGDTQVRSVPDGGDPAYTEMSQQLSDQRDKYLRLAAEYDNYRKRSVKERAEAEARGQAELVSRMVDAIDDLSRFAHIDPATTDPQTLHKGIELVEQKMLKTLGAAGLEVINPIDQTFDPTLHEAVATEPALSPEDDHTVGKVFQPGYRFNGQLLRPARVVVKQWNG